MIVDEPIRFLLIVKVPRGLNVVDTPRAQSQGAQVRRAVPVGGGLYAYGIHNIAGVEYARLVPQNPIKPEWVRVAEADHSIEYVDVIDLQPESEFGELLVCDNDELMQALKELATANTLLATALRELAKR